MERLVIKGGISPNAKRTAERKIQRYLSAVGVDDQTPSGACTPVCTPKINRKGAGAGELRR